MSSGLFFSAPVWRSPSNLGYDAAAERTPLRNFRHVRCRCVVRLALIVTTGEIGYPLRDKK